MRGIAYIGLSLILLLGAGCCKTLPVMPEPLACSFPKAALEDSCDVPVNIGDGATYSDLIAASIADRNALRKCTAHDRLLKKSIQECNEEMARYKAQVQDVNARYGTRH